MSGILTYIPRLLFWLVIRLLSLPGFRRRRSPEILTRGEKILFNASSGIGDAVMAIPLLKRVHSVFPDADISVIANRSTLPLFQIFTFIGKIYCIDDYRSIYKYFKFTKTLRNKKLEIYIGTIPSNTVRMILIPFLACKMHRIKHDSPHRGVKNYDFLFHHLEPIPDNRHRVDCNLDLMKALKVNERSDISFPLFELPQDIRRSVGQALSAEGYKQSLPLIAVHPGCNPKAHYKRWPPENYVRLLNDFQKIHHIQVLLVGGRDEKTEVQYIESGLVIKPLNITGKMNLVETACALSFCRFIISNDSGIMHLAAAVDIPVFAIFGPTNDRHIGPYGRKHTVIRNGEKVQQVSVDQVMKILLESAADLFHIK